MRQSTTARLLLQLLSLAILLLPCAQRALAQQNTAQPAKPAAKPVAQPAKPAATLVLSPIHINDVHDGDLTVSGIAPVPNVALAVKLNGVPGVSTSNSNATGMFAIVLPSTGKSGNFVEVSGKASNGTAIYGNATVGAAAAATTQPAAQAATTPAKPVTLSAPTIAAAHDGDPTISVTRNSADASQAALNIHVKLFPPAVVPAPATAPNPIWEGDCTPDSKTGQCSVAPNPPPLTNGQIINASETLSSGSVSQAAAATETVAAPQSLNTPTASGAEGTTTVTVTPNKSDAGRAGLGINVNIIDPSQPSTSQNQDSGSCAPDTAGDACSITLSKQLNGRWQIQAHEKAGSALSPTITANVTPIAALGAPTLTAPFQGDPAVTVALNAADAAAVKAPAKLTIDVQVQKAGAKPGEKPDDKGTCNPDSANSCSINIRGLTKGDQVIATEVIAGESTSRASDAPARAKVGSQLLGVPGVSKLVEGATSVNVSISDSDFANPDFKGKLSLSAEVYNSDRIIPGQTFTCAPASATPQSCTVSVAALAAGQTVHVREIPATGVSGAPSQSGPEAIVDVNEIGYNWGRVRAYFSAGTVFSRNNITTTSGVTTVGASNFSSPEAFVAFDVDFNLLTKQSCLAASYVTKPVKLATLARAIKECDIVSGSREKAQKQAVSDTTRAATASKVTAGPGDLTGQIAILEATRNSLAISESSTASILELLLRAYNRVSSESERETVIPARIRSRVQTDCAPSGQTNNSPNAPPCDALVSDLSGMELTTAEAEQLLAATGSFERRNTGGWLVNTYYDSKFTQTAVSNGIALGSSPNSFHVEGGIYAPKYFSKTRWTFDHEPYAMFVAPIAKLGFDSLRGSATDQLITVQSASATTPGQVNLNNAVAALSRDVYRMMAFGARFGFLRFSPTPNRAPETISYLDFTYGRFDNYFVQKYDDTTGAIRFPWRLDMTGLLKVPLTPLYIGLDLNKGVGPDNLTIFIGLRTDLSSLLTKLVPAIQ
jgi:hypothetical protein